MLRDSNLPVKEIAKQLCFADEYYFSNVFHKYFEEEMQDKTFNSIISFKAKKVTEPPEKYLEEYKACLVEDGEIIEKLYRTNEYTYHWEEYGELDTYNKIQEVLIYNKNITWYQKMQATLSQSQAACWATHTTTNSTYKSPLKWHLPSK